MSKHNGLEEEEEAEEEYEEKEEESVVELPWSFDSRNAPNVSQVLTHKLL